MPESKELARKILKEYADTLLDNAQDEAADSLIEVTRQIEENGEAVAKLIYELLGKNTDAT